MSKSLGNLVDPDEIVARFGADTCRLYTLFAAPPEKDMDWNDSSVEGQSRFLGRVYRFVTRNVDRRGVAGEPGAADRRALRKLHQTLKKITGDFDGRWHFNTSIAALMELVNELYLVEGEMTGSSMGSVLNTLVLMLAPLAPYMAEELWEELGHQGPVFRQAWPVFDEDLAREDEAEVVVQINGKVRARILAAHGTPGEILESMALEDAKVAPQLEGRQVMKVIVVPGKLVNIVIR